jgi:hypothetical protein
MIFLDWIARVSGVLPSAATVFLVLLFIAPRYFRDGTDWASWLRAAIGLSLVVLLGILAARMVT